MSAALPSGRAAWLAESVLPHEPELRQWLGRRVPAGLDVEDVVQEAYAILAGMESVDHVQQPRAYLFTVAQSVVLQQLRRAQVVSIEAVGDIERLEIPSAAPSPERNAASHQELRRVQDLIGHLPEKCRQAFWMRRVDGYSQREIAERLHISENTVEKHVGKGIRVLMDAMRHAPDVDRSSRDALAPGEGRHARKR
ncbi:RNA polymerase sigma factor [Xanthomonas massiliensis]|jgi:RNA polymerase sigma-70 factor (ECF subfamily)|uniref:RNA polymerase sigma factor n=1 Tax=Xanthomonas massiliensis TaxID=1720302 RepID=UPI00082630DA|nr:RNA polymerase sigma factor [Xanthomonas massiliensis]